MKKVFIYLCFNALILPIFNIQAATATDVTPTMEAVTLPVNGELQAAAATSLSWLGVVDKGQYNKSWDEMSSITKMTVSKGEWDKILTKTRKPLGSVKIRDVVDLRVATDPNNLPHGKYVVMIYKTSFSTKPSATELVTLFLQDGHWRVLTYQID